MCKCPDISFGDIEIVNSCINDQAGQECAGVTFHTESMEEKVIEIFLYEYKTPISF